MHIYHLLGEFEYIFMFSFLKYSNNVLLSNVFKAISILKTFLKLFKVYLKLDKDINKIN